MSGAPDMRTAIALQALRTEHELATEAAAASDEQVRALPVLLDRAQRPDGDVRPLDASKIAGAVLAVNARLHEQAERARKARSQAEMQAERAAANATPLAAA